MTKKTIIAVATAAILATSFGAAAWAKNKHDRADRMISHMTKQLDLDAGQVESLKLLQAEVLESRDLLKNSGNGLRPTLTEIISADSFDQQRALDAINESMTAFQSNTPDVVNAAAVFFDGLSADQKTELNGKIEKMQKWKGRHSH